MVPDLRERLWPYMGGIAKENGIFPKCIGGVADHVHLLLALPTTMGIAKAMQLINRVISLDTSHVSGIAKLFLAARLRRL